jgi:hypothetical protein
MLTQIDKRYIDKSLDWGYTGLSGNEFNFNYKNFKIKRLLILKNTINSQLHNWLWKPVCNDGLVSINPRLSKKDLNLM